MAKDFEMGYLLDFYGEVLTPKQREMLRQYYNDDLSLSEIGENFGITRQGARDAIKHGETTLKELEAKVGFAARYRRVQETLEQLEQLARVMPQLKDVILLLKGSSANIDAMETYLNTVHDGVAQLHAGSSTLNSQYGQFDAGVRQLANALTGMLGNLSVLTDGVNQLASRYGQLDSGLNAYTDGVAQLKAGVQQLTDGAAQLTAGTGELRSNVSGIDMGDQLDSLLAGLNGSSEVESFTSAENTDVSAVQFALQTVAIEAPAPAAEPEAAPVALTFWQKLLKLFGLYKG